LDIRVLGPVRTYAGGRALDLGPRKQRLVFAVLALAVNQRVSIDRLIELAWPVEPATDDDTTRIALLDRALSLWSGPVGYGTALSGTAPVETQEVLCRALENARLAAIEDRIDAELRLGRHRAVLAEVIGLAGVHPTRERFTGQLMICLYRDGRQTEALDTYRRLQQRLADEFGVDPGPALRKLHLAILREDPGLRPVTTPRPAAPAAGQATTVPAQLPPAVSAFVGRGSQLADLDVLTGDGPAIVVVSGMAGVGKTALVVQWGHRVRAEFPDGQLYVNLSGYAPGPPLVPARVLAGFLTALGVPAERVPTNQDDTTALYRTMLADRRVLVVLDNAAGPAQVRPLLPGGSHCRVVVTSRSRLGGLVARNGARSLGLGALGPDEAVELLGRLTGDEPAAVLADLAKLCAYLPLALRIAAARLPHDPGGAHGYLARLGDASRLAMLEIDDDDEAAVRAAFDLSYAALSPAARRMFRLLGLVPGTDVSVPGAATLAALAPASAAALLDALADAHLVDRIAPVRYGLHDLLRLYAAERARRDEDTAGREAALARLDGFYLDAADAAARLLYPTAVRLPTGADPATSAPGRTDPAAPPMAPAAANTDPAAPMLAEHQDASAWLDAERSNLVALVTAAAAAGRSTTAYTLGDTLAGYFWLRRHTADWLVVAQAALAAAVAADDPRAQAASHRHLSGVYLSIGRSHEATAELERALALARRAHWPEGQAAMLNARALAAQVVGDSDRAETDYLEALALYRAAGVATGEPVVLSNLAGLYGRIGRLDEAADAHRRALELDQRLDATNDVAIDLSNLGGACWRLGRLDEAERYLSAGLALHRQVGNRAGEANTLNYLAHVHQDAGRPEAAAAAAEADLAKAQDLGDPLIEVDAWNVVAGTRPEPATAYRHALEMAEPIGYPYGIAEALVGLAATAAAADRYVESLDHARRALDIAQRAGFHVLQGHAHRALATAHLGTGELDAARDAAEHAEAIYRDTGYRLGQARALRLLGAILINRNTAEATMRMRAALALFEDIGTPEAAQMRSFEHRHRGG
jgi:tetratricopeptide (TPR) repeat protein